MTLSARIHLRPSWRVALLEASLPAVGIVVAGTTLAQRWPGASVVLVVATVVAVALACGVAAHRWRVRVTRVVVVSDHPEVGVAGSDRVWRIAEPSLVRPGFSVLALAADGAGRRGGMLVPLFDADLAPADRRALHRFLGWCLRGGATAALS